MSKKKDFDLNKNIIIEDNKKNKDIEVVEQHINWYFYKRLSMIIATLIIFGLLVFSIYQGIVYLVETLTHQKQDTYITYKSSYTSKPGSAPEEGIDAKKRWKEKKGNKGNWGSFFVSNEFIHPLVVITILLIIITAFIGIFVIFRKEYRNYRGKR